MSRRIEARRFPRGGATTLNRGTAKARKREGEREEIHGVVILRRVSQFRDLGLLKNWGHGRPAHVFWPKKCTGETLMPPYSKQPLRDSKFSRESKRSNDRKMAKGISMPASVLNSLAANLPASTVLLPPKAAEGGADFAKQLDRAKDSVKAVEGRTVAKTQAGETTERGQASPAKGSKKIKENSPATGLPEAPKEVDPAIEVAAHPAAPTGAELSPQSDSHAVADQGKEPAKSKAERPIQSGSGIDPSVAIAVSTTPVVAIAAADLKGIASPAANSSQLQHAVESVGNPIPTELPTGGATATAPAAKSGDAKANETVAALEGSVAKASASGRSRTPVVAPLDDQSSATPVIAQNVQAKILPQTTAVNAGEIAQAISFNPTAVDAVSTDKHTETPDNGTVQSQSLLAAGSTPHAPVASHAQSAATPTPEPLPPEARFADANHASIISDVRTRLLPHGGSMQIRLDPPELGALQVSVEMRDGSMTATFQTSNEDATRLLSHSLGQLKTALEAQGVIVEKIQVQQAPKNQPSQSQEEQSPQQQRDDANARQEQQRREILNRMWRRVSGGSDPVDLVA